jgi:hypothetical protein
MAHLAPEHNDRLLEELNRHEQQLNSWLDLAPANAVLFIEDPVAALRAANLGISENMLAELEHTMREIIRKLAFMNCPAARCRKTAQHRFRTVRTRSSVR